MMSVFNFDDVGYVIKIDTALDNVQYTGVTCDKSATNISQFSYAINQQYSGWTSYQSSFDTIWGMENPFDYYYWYYVNHTDSTGYGYGIYLYTRWRSRHWNYF